jgi:hypothetical protein
MPLCDRGGHGDGERGSARTPSAPCDRGEPILRVRPCPAKDGAAGERVSPPIGVRLRSPRPLPKDALSHARACTTRLLRKFDRDRDGGHRVGSRAHATNNQGHRRRRPAAWRDVSRGGKHERVQVLSQAHGALPSVGDGMHGSAYGLASCDLGRRVFEQSGAIEREARGRRWRLWRAE